MIDSVLLLLRDQLNAHLHAQTSIDPGASVEDPVVLVDGDSVEPLTFKSGAVSALLVNIEEETAIRPADPFRRVLPNGSSLPVAPEIRLNLYVLFVARYKAYEQGLAKLSSIIHYFQRHRVLDHANTPALSDRIEKLVIELVTLPLSDQNELWGALRTTYLPSVLYRVRLVTVEEEAPLPGPEIVEVVTKVAQ